MDNLFFDKINERKRIVGSQISDRNIYETVSSSPTYDWALKFMLYVYSYSLEFFFLDLLGNIYYSSRMCWTYYNTSDVSFLLSTGSIQFISTPLGRDAVLLLIIASYLV